MAHALRLAQRVIDLTEGDPKGNILTGSSLAFATRDARIRQRRTGTTPLEG
jgi:hypothetical protein